MQLRNKDIKMINENLYRYLIKSNANNDNLVIIKNLNSINSCT